MLPRVWDFVSSLGFGFDDKTQKRIAEFRLPERQLVVYFQYVIRQPEKINRISGSLKIN